nr:Transcriptional activator protein CzcR [Paraburkholderia busanensis]
MRILIVDEDTRIGIHVRKGLSDVGYVTDWVQDGETGLKLALTGHYALIMLNVALPVLDGWTVLDKLRVQLPTPVFLLNADDHPEQKARGLAMGANEYMVKPVDFEELLKRVRALLRDPSQTGSSLRVGDLALDLLGRKAIRQGDAIQLTTREFSLLWLLMRRRGEVLARSTITSQVWDMSFDYETNVVEAAIRRVRAKVDANYEPKLIHTVRGVGYVLDERDPSLEPRAAD